MPWELLIFLGIVLSLLGMIWGLNWNLTKVTNALLKNQQNLLDRVQSKDPMTYAQLSTLTNYSSNSNDEYISQTDEAELARLSSLAGIGDVSYTDPEHAAVMEDLRGFGIDLDDIDRT